MTEPKTAKEWMEQNIGKYEDRQDFFIKCEEAVDVSRKTVQKTYRELFKPKLHKRDPNILEDNRVEKKDGDAINELRMENAKLTRENQRLEDRKTFLENQRRELLRTENKLEDLEASFISSIVRVKPAKIYPPISVEKGSDIPMGIVQLSDIHFNEEIDIPGNKYNFEVAGQRLAKFARLSKKVLHAHGVKRIVLAMTGDLFNSDRRADEYMTNTSNRIEGACMAVGILRQFTDSLLEDFEVTVCCVAGNESRLQEEWSWTSVLASDNFDCLLFKMLSMLHVDTPRINYLFGNPIEEALTVNEQNIVLTHGYKSGSNSYAFAAAVMSRFAAKDKVVNFVISGHKHNPSLGDFFGVSGSLSGGNTFGEFALNKACRASQNVYIIHKRTGVDGIKIDLQEGDSVGYSVDKPSENPDITDIRLLSMEK